MPDDTFATWAILELLGHRRLGGYLSEATIAGASFLRIDIPDADGQPAMTQYVAPGSVYAITPTTEDIARRAAVLSRPAPIARWELPAAAPATRAPAYDEEDDLEDAEGPL